MVEVMKKYNGENTMEQWSLRRRQFESAPNLSAHRTRGLVKPDELKKFKEMVIKPIETKTKNKKKLTKNKTEQTSDKEKLLIEPDITEQKNSDEIQWLIKKNVIKVIGSANKKKLVKKPKSEKKSKPGNIPTTRSESTKEKKLINQKVLLSVKSENVQELKRQVRPRKNRAIVKKSKSQSPKTSENLKNDESPLNIPTILQMTKPGLVKELREQNKHGNKVQRLKQVFNVFKPEPQLKARSKSAKKLDLVFSRELSAQADAQLSPKPKSEKKRGRVIDTKEQLNREVKRKIQKTKTPSSTHSSDFLQTAHQMKQLKAKINNKIRTGSALPTNQNKPAIPPIASPISHNRITDKKKQKLKTKKLVHTVNT